MLLTITTTERPATDLGYLLRKNPARVQSFPQSFGTPYGLVGLSQLGMLRQPRWDRRQIAEELNWGNRYFHKILRPDGDLMDHIVVPVRWDHVNAPLPSILTPIKNPTIFGASCFDTSA